MLRSSSTPILGSLLSSVPESHNHNLNHVEANPHNKHPDHTKLSVHQNTILSPVSPDLIESHKGGFRRVQSEGNLEASFNDKMQACSYANSSKPNKTHLQTIPSFSFYTSGGVREEEDTEETMSDFDDSYNGYEDAKSDTGIEGAVEMVKSGTVNHDEAIGGTRAWNLGFGGEKNLVPQQMYLAKGLGIGSYRVDVAGDGGGRKVINPADLGGGDDDDNKQDIEEHYKKMVEENPGNPLCLRNYAWFLYQTKRDLQTAEAYYSRAILADPTDGDILSQYAQLVWELNHERDMALSYFERAVHASPQDSHVHAAYANFLWETEEDDDEFDVLQSFNNALPYLQEHDGGIASVIV